MERRSIWMRSNTNKLVTKLSANNRIVSACRTAFSRLAVAACGFFCLALLMGGAARPAVKVTVKKFKNRHYQLLVQGKPYLVKGVCYNPIPVGKDHEYDWWSDPAKPWMIDGKLMQEMGINTVRLYQVGQDPEKVRQVIRDLYQNFGIRVILGHWLGFWEYPCPLYGDPAFQTRVRNEVLDMVRLYKDEPGVLMWILGNENNYSCLGHVNPWSTPEIDREPDPQKQRNMRATIYYTYVNSIIKEAKKIDKARPFALGNGELIGLEVANTVAPDVDIVACIIYRGKTFGPLFKSLRATFDRPILLSEFGADCFDALKQKEDQQMQAFFLESQWRQVYANIANVKNGEGNCIGGTMFEWTDEYWKHNPFDPAGWAVHDTESNWSNGSYYFDIQAPKNMNMNEEWFGIVALSPEMEQGVNKRVLRKAYYVVRELWKNPYAEERKQPAAQTDKGQEKP